MQMRWHEQKAAPLAAWEMPHPQLKGSTQPAVHTGFLKVTFPKQSVTKNLRIQDCVCMEADYLTFFPKSLRQIWHTPNRIIFPFIKLKWMHLHFSAKRTAAVQSFEMQGLNGN